MSVELPKSDRFDAAREGIEALMRSQADVFAPLELDEDGEIIGEPVGQSLCDWMMITHWIDAEGAHRYARVNSTMTPHALLGLRQMFND